MSNEDELASFGRAKKSSDTDSMRYIRLGAVAAKMVWVIATGIVVITLWAARLEWRMQANSHNIDKIWDKVFPKEPIKDE